MVSDDKDQKNPNQPDHEVFSAASGDEHDEIIEVETVGAEFEQQDSLSAGAGRDFSDLDDDLDIDEDGDFGFDETPPRASKGANMTKFLAPALVLVLAAGAGGYIIMNPQVVTGLIGGEAAPVSSMPSPTFDTAAMDYNREVTLEDEFAASGIDLDIPQPAASQNARPRGPGDDELTITAVDLPERGTLDEPPAIGNGVDDWRQLPFEQDRFADEESLSGQGDASFEIGSFSEDAYDLAEANYPDLPLEEPALEPAAEVVVAIPDVDPEMPDIQQAQRERDAYLESAAAQNDGEIRLAEATTLSETPAAISAPPAVTPRRGQQQPQPVPPQSADEGAVNLPAAGVSAQPADERRAAEIAAASGPDVYFDSALTVPSGPMSSVGPRKVNPMVEPASMLSVTRTTHERHDQEAILVAANRALNLGRYDSALEMFDQLYAKNKRDVRILLGRGMAQQNLGFSESAIQSYEKALELDPNNASAMLNMLGLIRNQYPEVALRRLMEIRASHPNHAGIAAQIGITEADLGNIEQAMRYLGMAASMEPNNAQHMFNMAVISDRSGNVRQAITFYEQALQVDAVHGQGRGLARETIYDRLATLRRRL